LASDIHKLIGRRDFYRWQALRIARTESTNTANSAALVAGDSSGLVYDKIWISGHDNRVRHFPDDNFDHRKMDGQVVAKEDYFETSGVVKDASGNKIPFKEYILHPGADTVKGGGKSSAGNIINCRCTSALIVKRDSNGRIMRTSTPIISKNIHLKAGFDPNQARNPDGTWGSGGSSNLEDRPCFKEWFSDSKVVDEDGNALTVYHGTNVDFDEFKPTKGFNTAGYFAKDENLAREQAEAITRYRGGKEKIFKVFLSISNLADFSGVNGDETNIDEILSSIKGFSESTVLKYQNKYGNKKMPSFSFIGDTSFIDDLRSVGFSGVKYNEGSPEFANFMIEDENLKIKDTTSFIAFKPNQIKSVDAKTFCHETNINKSI